MKNQVGEVYKPIEASKLPRKLQNDIDVYNLLKKYYRELEAGNLQVWF